LGGTVTEIDLDQNVLKAKKGSHITGYDYITLRMEQRSDGRCLVRITSDGIRPTLSDDKSRHW
jgi:hypothetical protein